ncbi:uncharacterized protein LOC133706749 [Rosa rugosa]|uniref:uncharacterized protein LOC133706749 n=1 Tax=Rosa rugosa TaxID=74645 RepID=UPI002B40611D|nr:uncharacterized protein LOC133706749 [Rosa rugosa]
MTSRVQMRFPKKPRIPEKKISIPLLEKILSMLYVSVTKEEREVLVDAMIDARAIRHVAAFELDQPVTTLRAACDALRIRRGTFCPVDVVVIDSLILEKAKHVADEKEIRVAKWPELTQAEVGAKWDEADKTGEKGKWFAVKEGDVQAKQDDLQEFFQLVQPGIGLSECGSFFVLINSHSTWYKELVFARLAQGITERELLNSLCKTPSLFKTPYGCDADDCVFSPWTADKVVNLHEQAINKWHGSTEWQFNCIGEHLVPSSNKLVRVIDKVKWPPAYRVIEAREFWAEVNEKL